MSAAAAAYLVLYTDGMVDLTTGTVPRVRSERELQGSCAERQDVHLALRQRNLVL